MQDARNLAWRLAGAMHGTECRAAARHVLHMTGLVARVALLGKPWSSARDLALKAAAAFSAVRSRYTTELAGLRIRYPRTALGAPPPERPRRPGRLSPASAVARPFPDWARPQGPATTYRLVTRVRHARHCGPAPQNSHATTRHHPPTPERAGRPVPPRPTGRLHRRRRGHRGPGGRGPPAGPLGRSMTTSRRRWRTTEEP
ncbi:hypothetical protein ABTX81_01460 [Kitasatospora sp. NPDC097605]|uniref:hypothetical protein n=1 Tax=Kitasatospora sp. NPDC097605 TaxID=3157226 RepID=UPI003323F2E8